MSSNVKKIIILYSLIFCIPAMMLAQEGTPAGEGTTGGQGMMKMRDQSMMGGWRGHGYGGPHMRGPFSSSYSSYTTTNNITSSGTSDCIWGGPVCRETFGKQTEQAVYIARMIDQISENAARGAGPYLVAMALLMDCPPAQADLFSREVKGNYPLIFSHPAAAHYQNGVATVLAGFHQVIDRHETLSRLCLSSETGWDSTVAEANFMVSTTSSGESATPRMKS